MRKDNCEKWLAEFLKDGQEILGEEVRDAARKGGFSKTDLKAARKALGVKTFHQFDEVGATNNYFWYLERRI